jgi:hypothetical protein
VVGAVRLVRALAEAVLVKEPRREVLRVQHFDVLSVDKYKEQGVRKEENLVDALAVSDVEPIKVELGLLGA